MVQKYAYRAMDGRGRVMEGSIDANNINELEHRLEKMGLDLIHYRIKQTYNRHARRKITRQDLITFCFYMEHLSRAGVPLLDGLTDLRDSLPQSYMREVLSGLIEDIQGGKTLSEAMRSYPSIFDMVFINLIFAGEESGQLVSVFQHLTNTLKWHDELIAKTKKLLMYPSFVAVVVIGVFFFLMTYLVPQLIAFIQNMSMGYQLPWHTRLLIVVSDFLVNYWYIVLLTPILLFFLLKFAMRRSQRLCFKIDLLKLRVWLIGPILEKIILARFANFFALLYGAGITVLDGLKISKALAGNLVIESAIQQVYDHIADGVSISESFERVSLFPPLVLRMVKVGESTGELDAALENISYFYNREVGESIEKIQTMIEPVMTIILGTLLGWVMLSVLGPIYDMITQFKF
ncbi:type II secretion system F family protein [Beggiatoa leptomitoformis]|uniref:Type II secretion system F family protein n=1 Tax=Beggiatoa leptomitoformis TaxID=288004 RepID=A0A2N9YAY5_9GAMM|nr:type II secretion system F family protein [Beggiatoa leptomitoformis]ALG66992.1 type II secretion system F family protein [Beggiatoa leptomitoformis]AUI67637.1 type II secretion system F family protein [Beggiatoa leptomitoformis]